jgi:hypothetical protein
MGVKQAKKFGDLNEDRPNNPTRQRKMDQHNNGEGRFIGGLGNTGDLEHDKEGIRDACQGEAESDHAGLLWTKSEVP